MAHGGGLRWDWDTGAAPVACCLREGRWRCCVPAVQSETGTVGDRDGQATCFRTPLGRGDAVVDGCGGGHWAANRGLPAAPICSVANHVVMPLALAGCGRSSLLCGRADRAFAFASLLNDR